SNKESDQTILDNNRIRVLINTLKI
ncbi:unnamed protein product, partial [Rotaria sp. Silwood2]